MKTLLIKFQTFHCNLPLRNHLLSLVWWTKGYSQISGKVFKMLLPFLTIYSVRLGFLHILQRHTATIQKQIWEFTCLSLSWILKRFAKFKIMPLHIKFFVLENILIKLNYLYWNFNKIRMLGPYPRSVKSEFLRTWVRHQ